MTFPSGFRPHGATRAGEAGAWGRTAAPGHPEHPTAARGKPPKEIRGRPLGSEGLLLCPGWVV